MSGRFIFVKGKFPIDHNRDIGLIHLPELDEEKKPLPPFGNRG